MFDHHEKSSSVSARLALVVAAIVAIPSLSAAEVPGRVPVQGFLTDAANMPINGSVQIEFRLYDTAAASTPWFAETQVVQVQHGAFTSHLGAVTPLDISAFRSSGGFLGVTIAGESEMTPRLEIGTVPFAAYAHETAAVPPGAIMFFDLDACPPGWSALDAARGRTLVGVPSGGARGGTVGIPYADLESRAHLHEVDPAAATTSTAGAHTHTIDPAPQASNGVSVQHSHPISLPELETSEDTHRHAWARWDWQNKAWYSYNLAGNEYSGFGYAGYGHGLNNGTGDNFPFQTEATNHTLFTDSKTHKHTVKPPIAVFNTHASSSTYHAHTVDIPATASSSGGAHAHTCDVPSTPSSAVSATPPYLQLLVCRKD